MLRVKVPTFAVLPTELLFELADRKHFGWVYLMLHHHGNRSTDGAWASVTTLAKECRMNPADVKAALRWLVENGWAERQTRPGRTSLYFLRIEAPETRGVPQETWVPTDTQVPTGTQVPQGVHPPGYPQVPTNQIPRTRSQQKEIQDPPSPPAGGGTAAPEAAPVVAAGKPEPETPAALVMPDPIGPAQADQGEVPAAPARKRASSVSRYWPLEPADVADDLVGLPAELGEACLSWWNEARRSRHGARATWTRAAWRGSITRIRTLHRQNPAAAQQLAEAGVESGWQALKPEYLQGLTRAGGGRPQLRAEDYLGPDGIVRDGPSTARGQAAAISYRNQLAQWGAPQPSAPPNPDPFAGLTLTIAPAVDLTATEDA